ncbi:MAG: DNA-binding protein [Nitrosopumilaceae archaeon]
MSEFQKKKEEQINPTELRVESNSSEPESSAHEPEKELSAPPTEPQLSSQESEKTSEVTSTKEDENTNRVRNVIFVGVKPIMTYVTATLTQLSSEPTVTIKARGKRITQAVDVSQMIVKRMNTVGYKVSDVRIASDSLTSQDGKQRNVSTIEIDISKT